MKDLFHNVAVVDAVEAPALNTNSDTDIVSAIVARGQYQSLLWLLILGGVTDAGCVCSVKVEHGDDASLSDAAAVDAADLDLDSRMDATPEATFQAAFDQTDDNKTFKIGYKGNKLYTRVTVSPVGNAAGNVELAMTVVKGHPQHGPVA
jgi:hypothetical protein